MLTKMGDCFSTREQEQFNLRVMSHKVTRCLIKQSLLLEFGHAFGSQCDLQTYPNRLRVANVLLILHCCSFQSNLQRNKFTWVSIKQQKLWVNWQNSSCNPHISTTILRPFFPLSYEDWHRIKIRTNQMIKLQVDQSSYFQIPLPTGTGTRQLTVGEELDQVEGKVGGGRNFIIAFSLLNVYQHQKLPLIIQLNAICSTYVYVTERVSREQNVHMDYPMNKY